MRNFDLAGFVGHQAITELAYCYELYTLPVEHALKLNNVNSTRMDFKQESTINKLINTISVNTLKIDDIDYIDAGFFGSSLEWLIKLETRYCIKAAIYFQTMMEAEINEELTKAEQKDKSFYKKWKYFFDKHNANPSIRSWFEDYYTHIYKNIRNKYIHSKEIRPEVEDDELTLYKTHKYIMYGWFCFVFLLEVRHSTTLNFQDNWKEMCTINKAPENLNLKYTNIEKLANELHKKHIDGLNKTIDKEDSR